MPRKNGFTNINQLKGGIKLHWPTHILIAEKIDEIINEKLQTTLNTKGLKYGSIKPDINPKLLRMKHLKHRSINQIGSMIEDMKNTKYPETKKDQLRFSMKLGIIMHYITDFFCYAHNNPEFKSKFKHFKYEWKVAFEYTKVDVQRVLINACNNVLEYNNLNDGCLKNYINQKHDEYMKNIPGIENDIKYSLEMCFTIALIIVGYSRTQLIIEAA